MDWPFQIEDDKIFQGFSDGSTWNGWSNPYFTLEVAKEVLEYYQNQSCEESKKQAPTKIFEHLHGKTSNSSKTNFKSKGYYYR